MECNASEQRLLKAEQALERLASGLNQRQLKTRTQIESALKKATAGAGEFLAVTFQETKTTERVQIGRGRPGPQTRYKEAEHVHYQLHWQRDEAEIARAQRTNGLFPLTDNTGLDPVEVLRTYKH